jgi:hypothetical protein
MTITTCETVPKNRLRQFNEILISTGGRYVSEPIFMANGEVRVCYQHGDYQEMTDRWYRLLNPPIRVVRKDQRWRRLWRRLWWEMTEDRTSPMVERLIGFFVGTALFQAVFWTILNHFS